LSDDDSDDNEVDVDDATSTSPLQSLGHRTEMDQIRAGVSEAITNLLRLSAAIRNPARHDQWLNFSQSIDTTPYEPYDIGHVVSKYPGISDALACRLGLALSRRRCYFKYRKEHHDKLASGLAGDVQDDQSTLASSLPSKAKTPKRTNSDLNTAFGDEQSDSGFTTTSFATSIADTTTLRVPPLPRGADFDDPFECQFCFGIIIVGNRSMWK